MRRLPACFALLLTACPAEETPDCPEGEVYDGEACVPEICGEDAWGGGDAEGTVHVAPDGSDDGDGSPGRPLASIQLALDWAAEAGFERVVLAGGTYAEQLVWEERHDGIDLLGRCRELVTLDVGAVRPGEVEEGGLEEPAVEVRAGAAVVAGLTLVGGAPGASANPRPDRASELTLRRVEIRDSVSSGVSVHPRGTVVIEDSRVRDTSALPDGEFGRGVAVSPEGELVARRVTIENSVAAGILSTAPGTRLDLEDVIVRGVAAGPQSFAGIDAYGAELVARRVTIEDVVGRAGLWGEDASATVEDLEVRRVRPRESGGEGWGVFFQFRSTVSGARWWIEDVEDVGVALRDSEVELADVTVQDVADAEDGYGGFGFVGWGGEVSVQDLHVERVRTMGVQAHGPGVLRVEGGSVRDVASPGAGSMAVALHADNGALFEASDLLVTGVARALEAQDEGTRVELMRVTAQDGGRPAEGGFHAAVFSALGASVSAEDVVVEGWTGLGMTAQAASLEVAGGAIRDTRALDDLGSGAGLVAQPGAFVLALEVELTGNAEAGAVALPESELILDGCTLLDNGFAAAAAHGGDLEIRGGRLSGTRASPGFGGGLGVFAEAIEGFGEPRVVVDGVEIDDLPSAGVYLAGAGELDVRACTISDAGTAPDLPGGVYLGPGVGAAAVDAVRIEDNLFSSIPSDAVLVDGVSATLAGNAFEDLGGEPLYRQRCDEGGEVDVSGQEGVDPVCREVFRETRPTLRYDLIDRDLDLGLE